MSISKLLHIDSSPTGAHSASRELTAALVEALQAEHPGMQVEHLDLAAAPIPHWTPHSEASDPEGRSSAALRSFLEADMLVIGAPMYNFGIPSQLKAWLDAIVVAGTTFSYTAEGRPRGLVSGKRVIVVSSRGGVYSEGPAQKYDFQEAYLRSVLGFLGMEQVEILRAEGLKLGEGAWQAGIEKAKSAIPALL